MLASSRTGSMVRLTNSTRLPRGDRSRSRAALTMLAVMIGQDSAQSVITSESTITLPRMAPSEQYAT